jgi:ribosomal protein S17E
MTAKEKAKELMEKYYNVGDQEFDYSKEFALIAVDEMLNNLEHIKNLTPSKTIFDLIEYWEEVKQEIEKL